MSRHHPGVLQRRAVHLESGGILPLFSFDVGEIGREIDLLPDVDDMAGFDQALLQDLLGCGQIALQEVADPQVVERHLQEVRVVQLGPQDSLAFQVHDGGGETPTEDERGGQFVHGDGQAVSVAVCLVQDDRR